MSPPRQTRRSPLWWAAELWHDSPWLSRFVFFVGWPVAAMAVLWAVGMLVWLTVTGQ